MCMKVNYFFFYLCTFGLCLSIFGLNRPIYAQDQSDLRVEIDSVEAWENIYADAIKKLRYGTIDGRIKAAYVLGAQRNPRFVRPLVKELLDGLKTPDLYAAGGIRGPYVKSIIAWSIGRIGHSLAVPGLLRALDLSLKASQKEINLVKKRSIKQAGLATKKREPKVVTLVPDRPGPFLIGQEGFHYNPDQNWSVSDDYKHEVSGAHRDNPSHRVRLQGANYQNLIRAILLALGQIRDKRAIDDISKCLEATTYTKATRRYASIALGDIGGKEVIKILSDRFQTEKNHIVKITMAYSMLRNDKTQSEMYFYLVPFLLKGNIGERYAAASAFRDLSVGEAVEDLKAAYRTENNLRIRSILRQAIANAQKNVIYPINIR